MADRAETLDKAIAQALHLAELTERKAGLLRDMAEALAAERWPSSPQWLHYAADIAADLERRAAQGKPATYKTSAGLVSCAWAAGRPAWVIGAAVLEAGQAIPKRQALALIAERMESRLA